jgi:hypothetical protein
MGDLDEDRFSDDEIHDAINEALNDSWPHWWEQKEDATETIATNTFIYTLNTDCEQVLQVWLERTSGESYRPLRNWRFDRVTGSTGTIAQYLYLDRNNHYESGKTLKVSYLAKPSELSNDTDNTNVADQFILYKARSVLYELEASKEAPIQDIDHLWRMVQWNQQKSEDARLRLAPNKPISHIHYDTRDGGGEDILSIPGVVDRYRGAA